MVPNRTIQFKLTGNALQFIAKELEQAKCDWGGTTYRPGEATLYCELFLGIRDHLLSMTAAHPFPKE